MGARAGSGAHRAVRRHPDRQPLGQGSDVRVSDRVGRQAERAAGARDELEGRRQQDDRLHAAPRRPLPQRQGVHGCGRQVLLRPAAEPAVAGERRGARPGACDREHPGAQQVRAADEAEEPGRPRVRLSRLEPLLGDGARGDVQPGERRPPGHRHRAVPAARLPAEQPRRVRPLPALLEAGASVPRCALVQDPHRRAGPRGGPAGRGDRRRHVLGRQREGAARGSQPEGPAGPDGGVPRAAVHDQAGREEAVARHPRPSGRQLRPQPPGDHRQGLQRLRRVQRPRAARVRPLAAPPRGPAQQVREARPRQGEGPDEGGRVRRMASRSR